MREKLISEIARLVKDRRLQLGMTQSDLSSKTRLSNKIISQIECCNHLTGIDILLPVFRY